MKERFLKKHDASFLIPGIPDETDRKSDNSLMIGVTALAAVMMIIILVTLAVIFVRKR